VSAGTSVGPPVVTTSGLEAVFRTGDGVGPVDVVIRPGECVLVVGPSGSGKSTLLRLLHGAVPQAISADVAGEVVVADRRIADVRVAVLADVIGVVAQDPESGVCLSEVDDEVAFPLENLAVDPAAIGPAVEVALARAGASHLHGRAIAELSGGELQRVALAAAIASSPRVLLLDEPTAMLDVEGITAVRHAIDGARRTTAAACVLVEHRLDELAGEDGAGLPERWIVLGRDGHVRQDALAQDLSSAALREIVAAGCWLPIDMELRAVLGLESGIDDPEADRVLLGLGGDVEATPVVAPPAAASPARPDAGPRGPGAPILRARGVAVARGPRRGRRPVLAGIDLDLHVGETTALVGANGSGKSTLLACLAGLERPSSGTLDGPRAGLVFQNPEHQFTATTVRAELTHGLPAASEDRVDTMLTRFGLEDLADHNPYRLSGGQKRRVSLAAMLLHERPFLLADEPAFGLDRHAAVIAMRSLRAVTDEGRGVLFSSHDLRAVAGYADRVLVLGDGRVLADTTPLGLLRDAGLLAAARLRPPRLVQRIVSRVDDGTALRGILVRLDDLALELRPDATAARS